MMINLVLIALLTGQTPGAGQTPDDLAAAKALYASAAYDEALARLSAAGATGNAAEIAEYQALCLIALGRTAEAEKAITEIVMQRPLYTIPDTDFSPKIVAAFHDVRRKVLPDAARALYGRGKAEYDNKQYSAASTDFRDLETVLSDTDMSGQDASAVGDLKMLADGFLHLSTDAAAAEAAKAAAPPPSLTAPAPAPDPVKPAPPPAPTGPKIYSAADGDVSRPVKISGDTPEWNPTSPADQHTTFQGLLELVVDEHGAVQSVNLRQSVRAGYDDQLLAAAKTWKFKPATRAGQPVTYRTFVQVVLQAKKHS